MIRIRNSYPAIYQPKYDLFVNFLPSEVVVERTNVFVVFWTTRGVFAARKGGKKGDGSTKPFIGKC
jgi:hypothetical protein